jgi:hypothetical protein
MKLVWHTDLERALVTAQQTAKPIVSLALLGRLDEELSCANSRFFRRTLYPNREVASLLSRSFVLHWRTVRPVPKVKIDFGDGRVVDRTLTGNSAHLVLDPRGRVADAIPGLYTPETFVDVLRRAGGLALEIAALADRPARERLRLHHSDRAQAIGAWPPPPARQYPTAREAGSLAVTKMRMEDPLLRFIEASAADDAMTNERLLHKQVHERFASGDVALEREPFVEWLYQDVFKMPLDDPWLGLGNLG